ncbi:recombinase family protein [Desulfocurvibacter africanus]|uniref:recombinase family protein n=1 Tax=Desulfocurvibacter africanus TaxID=873 RepID=UPI000484EA1D|nr:recombinase family protein [Desulfocurvibacter africanus]
MTGQHVGYIRVSTTDQNTARQLEGHELDRVFEDKASAKDAQRPQLTSCLAYLREGDILHVHSIDRLARNLQDLLSLLEGLIGRGVSVKFHKENLHFTGESSPFQLLQLQIIGAVAQFERALIRERQREGIEIAKKAGKYRGRRKALTGAQVNEIRERLNKGERKASLAREYGISRPTLYSAIAS